MDTIYLKSVCIFYFVYTNCSQPKRHENKYLKLGEIKQQFAGILLMNEQINTNTNTNL